MYKVICNIKSVYCSQAVPLRDLVAATVTPEPEHDFTHENLYGINVTGIEVATIYRFDSNWKLNGSFSLQNAKTQDGKSAPNASNWLSKIAATGPIWGNNIFAAFELYATGPSTQEWEGQFSRNSTLVESNLAFTAENVLPKLHVQLRINNLFNRDDAIPGTDDTPVAKMPVYRRNALLGVRYEF